MMYLALTYDHRTIDGAFLFRPFRSSCHLFDALLRSALLATPCYVLLGACWEHCLLVRARMHSG